MTMSSEHMTIEMAPVSLKEAASAVPVHSSRVDIEKASGTTPTVGARADEDLLRLVDETNQSDRPSSPLLSPRLSSRNLTNHEANTTSIQPSHPLLETDAAHRQPPLARPEIDDQDNTPESTTISATDIDDRLLNFDDNDENSPDIAMGDEVDAASRLGQHSDDEHHENGTVRMRSAAGDDDDDDHTHPKLENRFGEEVIVLPNGVNSDVNVYQQKKNLAQGMMDLALLSANANQLRYVIESSKDHPYFLPSIAFISISIILQIFVGIGLILNSRYNVTHDENFAKADKVNNFTVIGIFLVTIVNVFITSFSVAQPSVRAS